MAQTYQFVLLGEGGRIDHTPGSAVAAGEVVVTNGLLAFATQDIPANVLGTLRTAGGPPLVRGVKVNGGISVGNAVYWDADGNPQGGTAGTGALTTTATANTFAGRCVKAAGATDETVDFEMSIGVVTAGTLENLITDPGASGAIPVTRSGRVEIVTAGAESRTLAAPATGGLQLQIEGKTLVGACTITCATTVNQNDDTTITLTNAGDMIVLNSVAEGSNFRWKVTSGTESEALLSTP